MKLPLRLAAALLAASFSHAATLPASEDSYGFRAKLTLAANKAATLPVDATHRAFIWFDLADLPPGATLRYARLRLYLPRVLRAGGGLSVHRVNGTWDESLASTEPAFIAAPLANLPADGLGTKRFISVDVTATVQGWLAAPASNEGFAIAAIPGVTAKLTASVSLGAKEGAGSGYPAELDVEIADDPIAPGAVGSTQLAAGAVQSGNIASGAVGSTQLAPGAVQSANIANGAVTSAQLAKPTKTGSIAFSELPLDFGVNTFSVTFTTAFNSTPNVVLSVESGASLFTSFPIWLESKDAAGFSGKVPISFSPVTLDSAGNVGNYISMEVVNGNPAIGYWDVTNNDLKYVRALDASGSSWSAPATIDSNGAVGYYPSLAVVNGNPAISYFEGGNRHLKYVRALDASGTSWGTPATVDTLGNVGYTSLAVVNGNPAISYNDSANGDLKYVRALNASGTSWGTPATLDSAGNVGQSISMAVVNGNPAISYNDSTNGDLKYVRALDASGSSWSAPATIDIDGGYSTSLAVVNGNPAISYYGNNDLKYVRALDASGSSWSAPATINGVGSVGNSTSLAVVNGNPAISYYDQTNSDFKFIRSGVDSVVPFTIQWFALEP